MRKRGDRAFWRSCVYVMNESCFLVDKTIRLLFHSSELDPVICKKLISRQKNRQLSDKSTRWLRFVTRSGVNKFTRAE